MKKAPHFLLALALGLPVTAWAQGYPSQPISWIVPFPPGGTTDVVARIVAQGLSRKLGQSVTVVNRAGAGGSIGTQQLARARPDGYTIGMATVSTHAVNPACNARLGYDPLKDFVTVTNLARTANVLVVNNQFPAKNHAQFLAALKVQPGKYSYASTGHCSGMHMMGEMYKVAAKASMVHVPYRGAGPALNDLMGGQVLVMFDNLPSSIGHIRASSIRALAVAAPVRIASLPDIPTFKELGLADVNDPAWYGVVVPAGTSDAVVQRLNQALSVVLADPAVRDRLQASGAETVGNSSQEFEAEIRTELDKMRRVAKQQGITFEQ